MNIMDEIYGELDYVGKVNQNNVSVPINHAAIGNEDYIDIYNTATAGGFEVTGAPIEGVVLPNEYSVPTENDDKLYPGMYEAGNIDLHNRPIVQNDDGSISTIASMSFSPGEGKYTGKEILIPTVLRNEDGTGKIVTPEEAIDNFNQTGEHLGIFNDTENANAYAQQLHSDQASEYSSAVTPADMNKFESIISRKEDRNSFEGGVPTGFAASIVDSGDREHVPQASNRVHTKEEIKQKVTYYARIWDIPEQLAHAVVRQESGYQQKVGSSAGAKGIMQLMPGTAKSLGVTNIYDADQNIWGGMKYLAQQFKQFGAWDLALAAYNAGPGRVKQYKGIPPIAETQRYVKNILSMAGMSYSSTYPVTFEFVGKNKTRYIDSDTNKLSLKGMNDFMYIIENGRGYKGKVNSIYTNRPELLEDKPEYADWKKYRDKKGADGKPLFRKSEFNGFKVNIKQNDAMVSGNLNLAAIPALADDAAKTQTDVLERSDRDSLEALIETFSGRYKRNNNLISSEDKRFGLANLTADEYEDYGVPLGAIHSPIMQSRVLAQEFQRARDILGSERKAIYALAGGTMEDSEGNIRSWEEIKNDKDNFVKEWYIKPSKVNSVRNKVNSTVATYERLYNRIKGI